MFTFGHGRSGSEELAALLAGAGVRAVVDIRRFPGSRTNPAARPEALEALTTRLGISYRWEERLGGRRSLTAAERETSPDTWWKVPAFRAYASWTRSADFASAVDRLVGEDPDGTALMCSESVWWRCHRRIVADVLVAERGLTVVHLMPGGRRVTHVVSEGARLSRPAGLVWDGRPGAATAE